MKKVTHQKMLLITDSELSNVLAETLENIGKDELIALLKAKPVKPKKRGRPAGKTKDRDFQLYVFWCFIRAFYKIDGKGAVMEARHFIAEKVFYLEESRARKIIKTQEKAVTRILADMGVNQQAIDSGEWAIRFLLLLSTLKGGTEGVRRYKATITSATEQLLAISPLGTN